MATKRKRKSIPSTEDLREELECPVCLEVPTKGSIYQCESGHIHCHKCHPRLRECPTCKGPIGNTRALKLEKIVAMLPTKCAFTEYGCQADEKLPEEMLLHEKECQFRSVKCYDRMCKEEVPVSDYADHCKIKHNWREICEGRTAEPAFFSYHFHLKDFKKNDGTWKRMKRTAKFIKTRKHTFVIGREFDQNGFTSLYVFILGTQTDIANEKYYCKVFISNRDRTFRLQQDRGPVNIIDEKDPIPSLTVHPKQLLNFVDNKNKPNEEKRTYFRFGIFIGSTSNFEKDDLVVPDKDCSDFIFACDKGNEADIDQMLKNSTELQRKINIVSPCGKNGLMIACLKGYAEIVSLLLKNRKIDLNINATDKKGQSGLTMAVLQGHFEIVRLLASEPNVKIGIADNQSKTPFMYACQYGFEDMVAYFLKLAESKKNFNLNAKDRDGNTAFHLACLFEQDGVVNLIMQSVEKLKIETALKNKDEKTGFDLWPDKFEDGNAPGPSKRPRIMYP